MAGHHGLGAWSRERRRAGEHLVQHAPQTVHVAAAIQLPLATDLLRAHVVWRTETEARLSQPPSARYGHHLGDAEIGDYGVFRLKENVLGFDVSMDYEIGRASCRGKGQG